MRHKNVVDKLVKKLHDRYPTVPRPFLHKHVRLELEHRKILFTKTVEKQLQRALERAFSSAPAGSVRAQQHVGEEDPLILKAINRHLANNPQLNAKKRLLTEIDIDEILDLLAPMTGKPRKEYEGHAREVITKHFEEREQT